MCPCKKVIHDMGNILHSTDFNNVAKYSRTERSLLIENSRKQEIVQNEKCTILL